MKELIQRLEAEEGEREMSSREHQARQGAWAEGDNTSSRTAQRPLSHRSRDAWKSSDCIASIRTASTTETSHVSSTDTAPRAAHRSARIASSKGSLTSPQMLQCYQSPTRRRRLQQHQRLRLKQAKKHCSNSEPSCPNLTNTRIECRVRLHVLPGAHRRPEQSKGSGGKGRSPRAGQATRASNGNIGVALDADQAHQVARRTHQCNTR